MSDIFISYARKDREQAKKLAQALQALGWSVWWDRDTLAGSAFEDVIDEEIGKARCLVVLWSKNSVTSEWVRAEVHEGAENKKRLIQVLLESVRIPSLRLRRLHARNLEDWDGSPAQASFKRLVRDLEGALGAPPASGQQQPKGKEQEDSRQASKPTAAKRRPVMPKVKKPAPQTQTARLERGVEIEFVEIPAGEFEMGSEDGGDGEKPVRRVEISRSFQLGKYPVTQEQWEALMGSNPSHFKGAKRPVEEVSWDDVQKFIGKMNQRDDGFEYRLPTEAEWEYAARAGTSGDYAGKLEEMAWYNRNSDGTTHPVGEKEPNDWGLYDMHGNVWEWVQDRYDDNYYGSRPNPDKDPQGPEKGSARVIRGGGWGAPAGGCRSANRGWSRPGGRGHDLGFRLLRQAR